MSLPTDIQIAGVELYFMPVTLRVPLKFGAETLTSATCARVKVRVRDRNGREGVGWGETPLSVPWVWPSPLPFAEREAVLKAFCRQLAQAWSEFPGCGHALEVGHDFQASILPRLVETCNRARGASAEPLPWLAALVCCAPFDLALHDAFGVLAGRPVYAIYGPEFMSRDLGDFIQPAADAKVRFRGQYPCAYLRSEPMRQLWAWHLVGGVDPVQRSELTGQEPADGYPVLLEDWLVRDGLRALKIKLRGTDASWDYQRLVTVGEMAAAHDVYWLSADFNCTVREPGYVNELLDRLRSEHPRLYGMLLYVEQPFPYELEQHAIDVHSVASRKPLFLDESAHDWRLVRLGRSLGWTGVALKTCKTQTGAVLSACWAKAHGMALMVQDLTNPRLAQVTHVLLAAHVDTVFGVETNAMQFYPEASSDEARVHPGLFQRRDGKVDLRTISGAGFGYRVDQIGRALPEPAVRLGS
jgi:L-alanine-DL-glutamate epimerase-like enolase superfamily enzyme